MSRRNRPITKDMYWFAHGGSESTMNKNVVEEETEYNSIEYKRIGEEQKFFSREISLTDGSSSGPSSLEKDDRLHTADKRMAVEERKKQLWEAEQERNDILMKKRMERDAALEGRRNAQRSTMSFAFGSSVPRNVDSLSNNHVEVDSLNRSFTRDIASSSSHRAELHNNFYDRRSMSPIYSGALYMVNGTSHQPESSLSTYSEKVSIQSGCLVGSGAIIVEDVMSKSMTACISASRGRRKNDLMPTVPYDRTAAPRVATSSSSRRRSVSMTRLDQLAQPRKHYVEATKANSTASSGTSSLLKDACSPNRPLSSASEHSGGRATGNVTRRVRSSPRKPRPISIAGSIPDHKAMLHYTPSSKKPETSDLKKATPIKVHGYTPKSTEKAKSSSRPATAPAKATPKSEVQKSTPKPTPPKTTTKPKATKSLKPQVTKSSPLVGKKKNDVQASSSKKEEESDKSEKSGSPLPDSDPGSDDKNKKIISEEEAKAALAEKRRLAREQAEREAELERQRQEELRRQEEERLQREEEEQKRIEEESLRLLEEHLRQEEEKLQSAIKDQELKREEERARLEEELRLKAEQDRKAKEEAEKIRLELEEKLRREEKERAERKKRLEKIMSRTRGKSTGTSPSGSVSGSDHMDSGENQSSGANSLESNDGNSPVSSDDAMAKMEVSPNSLEANLTYEFSSGDVSLNSNDLMLPSSEVSQDESMGITLDKEIAGVENEESSNTTTPVNVSGGVDAQSDQLMDEVEDKSNPFEPAESTAVVFEDSSEQNPIDVSEQNPIDVSEQNPIDVSEHSNEFSKELHEAEKNQLVDEISILKEENNYSTAFAQPHVEAHFVGLENNMETHDFEPTFEEIASPLDSGLIPSNGSSENHENFMPSAASGEIPKEEIISLEQKEDLNSIEQCNEVVENLLSECIEETEHVQTSTERLSPENQTVNFDNVDGGDAAHIDQTSFALLSDFGMVETESEAIKTEVGNNIFLDDLTGAGDASEAFQGAAGVTVNNPFSNHFDEGDTFEAFKTVADGNSSSVNLINNYVSNETEQNLFSSQFQSSNESSFLVPEKADLEVQNVEKSSGLKEDLENVTLIRQNDSDKYMGIISSLDNDTFSNSFPKLNEQLTNNLECASTTESEDSSLDSNLSQVIATEEEEKDSGNKTDNFVTNSIPQSGDNHYPEFEVYSNGHNMESSKIVTDYGNSILGVENNMFDNVEAMDIGKISSDPFLGKGSSNQISGNPFLMQEEQNPKVLMTSDFLN